MSPDKLTPDQISKIAEDVRTIKKFQNESLNNGFDASLIEVLVTPSVKTNNKID